MEIGSLKKHQILTLCLGIISCPALMANSDIIQGHVGGLSNQLNRDIGDVPGNRYQADIYFYYHNQRNEELEKKFEFSALINDESLLMYSLQEAYVNKKGFFKSWNAVSQTGDQLKVGRQVLPWSQIDQIWGLGKLNNRKNFDFFEPGQEGLTGVYYENKSSSGFFWGLFGSGLYVPELNPSLDINKNNNTITSRNPWADSPAASTVIEGNVTPIQYIVDYPKLSEVVYRHSIGLNLGLERKNWVIDGFVMRKPENQISSQVEVALAENSRSVKAFISPQFYYHDVYGGNFKYRNLDFEMHVSGIAVNPNTFPDGSEVATTYTEIKTEKIRESYLGGGVSKSNDIYAVGLNYVARLSPFDRELDSLAKDPRWNQALNAYAMRNFMSKFQVLADIKYDMLTTDRLLMLRAGYKVTKGLLITLGVNMIGTPDNGKSFWSPFTNNDAAFVGARYIF